MEQIKKKLASLKQEKDDAIDKAEEAERGRKEAEARAEAVSQLSLSEICARLIGFRCGFMS